MVFPYAIECEPAELFPDIPPRVARFDVEVSGPNRRPIGRTWAFSSSWMTPGWTRHQSSSGFTSSTRCMYLEKSRTIAWLTVWPMRLVPPPRGRTGTLYRLASSSTARTSSFERGRTTPMGSTWYMDASVE